jgi:hypothetical protein
MVEKGLFLTFALIQASSVSPTAPNTSTPLTFWVQVGSVCGAVLALLTFALTQTWPRIKTQLDRRSLQKRIGAQSYTSDGIERSLRYFVAPLCQDIDPSGEEEPRMVYGVKQKLYDALDDALANPTSYKYLILLADSGMGKTTALLNYYAKHLRKWFKPQYKVALVPLNNANADDQVEAIEDQPNTVLLLDALDEDTLAMVDYKERLRLLLKATNGFRTVVISCRTQFFSKDEEIPKQTGVLKVSARAAGEEAEYCFHKIYLSPFSDKQINRYIHRRYPFWRRQQRGRAKQMVLKIPRLTARPMLLAHVDDLIKTKEEYQYAYELYAAMVKAWIERERGFIEDADALNQFSERLAVDIFINRFTRKAERIPKPELTILAKDWGISLEDWKLTGRSLLNRDAEGNFKFAHRSIMEYLFVKSFIAGNAISASVEWTDQMKTFLWEMLQKQEVHAGIWHIPSLHNEAPAVLTEIIADHLYEIFAGRSLHVSKSPAAHAILAALIANIVNPNQDEPIGVDLFACVDGSLSSFEHFFSYVRGDPHGVLVEPILNRHPLTSIPKRFFDNPIVEDKHQVLLIIAPPHFAPVGIIGIRGTKRFNRRELEVSRLLAAISNAGWNKRYVALRSDIIHRAN